jgi:hypothetical protein
MNTSAWCKVPTNSIVNTASKVRFTLQFTAGSTASIGRIALLFTAPHSPTVVSTVAVSVNGSPSPTISIPAGTSASNPFLVTTDAASVTIDGTQDVYLVVYFANSINNDTVGVSFQSIGSGMPVFGGLAGGDQTAISNTVNALGNTASTGTSQMYLFGRLFVSQ